MPYSIVKMDDSYVIRVGDQDFLKVNSRRKAAKLISDVQKHAGDSGENGAVEDGAIDESEDIRRPEICFQRLG